MVDAEAVISKQHARRSNRFVCLVLVALLFAACSGGETTEVLFIGNSYTFGNNLPDVFSELSASGGHEVTVGMVAPGGWWLADHADSPETAARITSDNWDYVFLQEQSIVPSVQAERVGKMKPAVVDLVGQIKEHGATPVLYMTWARQGGFPDVGFDSYQPMQDAITAAYLGIGQDLLIPIAPVGVAWNRVLIDHPEIPLYMSDGSHPTPHGSYLAACVFYATVFGESPVGLEYDGGLGAELAGNLQQVAADAVLADPTHWNVSLPSE